MKTIVIWDSCGEEPLKFFVVYEDKSHLNGCYINGAHEEAVDELYTILGYNEDGIPKVEMLSEFPINELGYLDDNDVMLFDPLVKVITCGFIP